MRTLFLFAASLILLFVASSPSDAGMVRLSVVGNVITPEDPAPPFNLADGDTVRLIAVFDEELRPGGAHQTLVFGENGNAANGRLRFEIGDVTFDEEDDPAYNDADTHKPEISFNGSGQLSVIDFRGQRKNSEIFNSVSNSASLLFIGQGELFGEWDPASAAITTVSIPASLALILPAFFSVWVFQWRQRRWTVNRRKSPALGALRRWRADTAGVEPLRETCIQQAT